MKTNNYLKRIPRSAILAALLFLSGFSGLSAQNEGSSARDRIVTGTVVDANGDILLGVNVAIKGTSTGTVTDLNGHYSIRIAQDPATLVFSYVGFEQQEILLGSDLIIHIVMLEQTVAIEEVVVVGYGVQEKESLLSAIDQVSGTRIQSMGLANVSGALAGMSPGLTVISGSGQPGSDQADLYIRGRSSMQEDRALVVVDGVEQLADFSYMDPQEIASVSILKDAAATAVYGVKGANGVIIITTNRGRVGKPKISFSSTLTLKQPTKPVKLSDSYNTLRLYNIASRNDGAFDKIYSDEALEHYRSQDDPYRYPSIDWYDALVKDVALGYHLNFSANGGTEFVKYFVSLGYVYDGDMFREEDLGLGYNSSNSLDNFNYRVNLDFDITSSTQLRTDFAGRVETQSEIKDLKFLGSIYDHPPWATPRYYPGDILNSYPDQNPLNPNENMLRFSHDERLSSANPYTGLHGVGQQTRRRTVMNANFELIQKLDFISKGLSLSGRYNLSANYQFQQNVDFDAVTFFLHTDGSWQNTTNRDPEAQVTNSRLETEDSRGKDDQLFYSVNLNYKRSFGIHSVTALGLFSRKELRIGSDYTDYKEDWVGRATYDFDKKYFLEGSAAYNGTDKFADGHRFGFFPAVAVGWNIARESFFSNNISFISQLKVRYTWGQSGSEAGASKMMYLGTYRIFDEKQRAQMRFGNEFEDQGGFIVQTSLENPLATWETATKENIGIDFSAFGNRFYGSVDFFREHRDGIFQMPMDIPSYFGAIQTNFDKNVENSLREANIGEVKKHGYEIALNYSDAFSGGLSYFVNFSYGFNENRRVYLGEPPNLEEYLKKEGKPLGINQVLVSNGYYSNIDEVVNYAPHNFGGSWMPGDLRYVDYNADGEIDADNDRAFYGNPEVPNHLFSLTFGLEYKGFGFRIFANAVRGVQLPARSFYLPFRSELATRVRPEHFDYWRIDNQNAKFPVPHYTSVAYQNSNQSSSYNLLNGDYLRLKNVEFSYTWRPRSWVLGLSECKFFVSAHNVLTYTTMIYGDPEGKNAGQYPIQKRYNFGIKANF